MKELIKRLIDYGRRSTIKMIGVSTLIMLIVALPFIVGIVLASTLIENEALYMTIDAILFIGYIITFIFTVNALNK